MNILQAKKVIAVTVHPLHTIKIMKVKLERLENIPFSHQQLLFKRKPLEDENRLSDLGIQHKSMLYLLIKKEEVQK